MNISFDTSKVTVLDCNGNPVYPTLLPMEYGNSAIGINTASFAVIATLTEQDKAEMRAMIREVVTEVIREELNERQRL